MKPATAFFWVLIAIAIIIAAIFFYIGGGVNDAARISIKSPETTQSLDRQHAQPWSGGGNKPAKVVTFDNVLTERYGEEKTRRVNVAIKLLGEALSEIKGMKTEVVYASGGALKLRIPPLQMTERQVEGYINELLVKFTGDPDSIENAKDPALLGRIKFVMGYDLLRSDLMYEFEKTGARQIPDVLGAPMSYDFNMLKTADRDLDGNPVLQQYKDSGFALSGAGNQFTISWSALARAPAGYFSSHVIRGNEGMRRWKGLESSEDIKTGESLIFDYVSGKETRIPPDKK